MQYFVGELYVGLRELMGIWSPKKWKQKEGRKETKRGKREEFS